MSRPAGDSGSAVVEFVAVSALLTLVFLGVLQLALALHVRSTLIDCASEGARYGGLADRSPQDGAQRTRDLVAMSLGQGYRAQVSASTTTLDGSPVVEVRVSTALPAVGLWGPADLTVVGHGLRE